MNRCLIALFGKNHTGWETLLKQEGLPYSVNPEDLSADAFSVAVVGEDMAEIHYPDVISYLKNGGSLLCPALVFARLTGEKTCSEYVKYLSPEAQSPFRSLWMVEVEKKCTLLKRSNFVRTQNGTPAVYIGGHSGGHAAVLPFDCGQLVSDERYGPKSFYGNGKRFPHEVVSTVSKGSVRRLFSRSVELLHHSRGFPFIQTWYYPHNEEPPFILRIDTDFAAPDEVDKLYNLMRNSGISAAWFVDAKSQMDNLSVFKNMTGQEIALHCYDHRSQATYEMADADIRRGLSILREQGIVPSGYASPYGKWNSGTARAISDNGFEYSSEFSYDYDNMPSLPCIGSGLSAVLQIPVHPISIGTLRRQGFKMDLMKDYFRMIIEHHLAGRMPVILYHHPGDGNEEVLNFVISYIKEKRLKIMTMSAFARWWKKRNQSGFIAALDGQNVTINRIGQNDDCHLRITRKDGTETFIGGTGEINLDNLAWNPHPGPFPPPGGLNRIRKFNPWIAINKFEDAMHRRLI